MATYIRAIENRDLGLLRNVWPTVSAAELKELKEVFARPRTIEMMVDDVQIQSDRTTAQATVWQMSIFVGGTFPTAPETGQVVRLKRTRTGKWVIESIHPMARR